jgi:putative oxidoreductase
MVRGERLNTQEWMVEHRHHWIEGLRIFLGGLLFYKGYYFVENLSVIYTMIGDSLAISPFIVAHYVVSAHLVGGVMLVFGILTRLAAFVQIPVLCGAVFFVHGEGILFGPPTELEYAILVLILLIVFFFYGGGKWSVDYQLSKQEQETRQKDKAGEAHVT